MGTGVKEAERKDPIIRVGRTRPDEVPGGYWTPHRRNRGNTDIIEEWMLITGGSQPTEAELPSKDETGEVTIVEGSETESRHSPQFPSVDSKKMKSDFDAAGAPSKGAKID